MASPSPLVGECCRAPFCPTIAGKAEAGEAEQHHHPGRGLRHPRNGPEAVVDVLAGQGDILGHNAVQERAAAAAKALAVEAAPGATTVAAAAEVAAAALKAEASAHADAVMPAIREAQAAGAKSLRQIAAALNSRGIATARGGK